jgi:pimeloyl-ACP methyl ester carboxylesterase
VVPFCNDRAMPRAVLPSGIELEYETFGDPTDPTLLLVCGYTSQMSGWDPALCGRFVAQGLHVVRYDNRDVGLSTKLSGSTQPMKVLAAMLAGEPTPDVQYTLSHMAADGMGLLDHLGIDRAHIAGVSMGGMIVQTMAIEHPDRVVSLTSIMSSTGAPRVGAPTSEARNALLAAPPSDREAYIDASVGSAVWASKKHVDLDAIKARAAADFDRMFYPAGAARQLAAIYASGDRSEALGSLDVPTLVIHGRDDTLITPSGGEATAALIDGSRLLLLADMGHDLPQPLWPVFAEAIGGHVRTTLEPVGF